MNLVFSVPFVQLFLLAPAILVTANCTVRRTTISKYKGKSRKPKGDKLLPKFCPLFFDTFIPAILHESLVTQFAKPLCLCNLQVQWHWLYFIYSLGYIFPPRTKRTLLTVAQRAQYKRVVHSVRDDFWNVQFLLATFTLLPCTTRGRESRSCSHVCCMYGCCEHSIFYSSGQSWSRKGESPVVLSWVVDFFPFSHRWSDSPMRWVLL